MLPALTAGVNITVDAISPSIPLRMELWDFNGDGPDIRLRTAWAPSANAEATINFTTSRRRELYIRIVGPPSSNDVVTITIN